MMEEILGMVYHPCFQHRNQAGCVFFFDSFKVRVEEIKELGRGNKRTKNGEKTGAEGGITVVRQEVFY